MNRIDLGSSVVVSLSIKGVKIMQGRLSTFRREELLQTMSGEQLDLLVIGGGITGAGIALDAASRGLRVGLVEKQDFSAGTSSRSTKLIHGGLRYLKQGEISLVREVGRERAILYRNAPHLVIPEKMLLPLVKGGTYGRIATSLGLWMYDRLAGVQIEERRMMLSKEETERQEPLLRKDILKGGGLYIEYRTDDARLTLEVLKTAAIYGAVCVNYAEVTSLLYHKGRVEGVQVQDRYTGKAYSIFAKSIVNATGPWADLLREMDGSLKGKRLHLTKGVHLVVPYHRFPLKQSVYFDVPDGRMVFAIPRNQTTYIGTTYTDYRGNLETPRATKEDALYLLNAVNYMFPSVHLTAGDIISSWTGLRPLIHEEGKAASELSRKDEIFISDTGLITIAGGKLTGFRKMAERIVDLVIREMSDESKISLRPCYTDQIQFSGGEFGSPDEIPLFVRELADEAKELKLSENDIRSLVQKYGTNTKKILAKALLLKEEKETEDCRINLALAELEYGIEEEMVTNLSDFLIRRTGKLFFERDLITKELCKTLLHHLALLFSWSEDEQEAHTIKFEEEYRNTVEFL